MSVVAEPCPDCGKPVTILDGELPGRCYSCFQAFLMEMAPPVQATDTHQADCFTQPDRLTEIRARHDFIHSNAAHCMTVAEMDRAYLLTELDRLRKLVKDVAD